MAPTAWATTASFAGPYSATNSITFTNWNSLGVNLTVLCGVGSTITGGTLGGNSCTFASADGTTNGPLGVNSGGPGNNAYIGGFGQASNDELVMFQFNQAVTLTNVNLVLNGGNSSFAFYACSGTALSNCGTQLFSASGVSSATYTSPAFSSTGQNFAIIVTNSSALLGVSSFNGDFASVPEPATLSLVGVALLGLGGLGMRRSKAKQRRV